MLRFESLSLLNFKLSGLPGKSTELLKDPFTVFLDIRNPL